MKKYVIFLLLLSSCTEKESPERADDPKYLLVKQVHRSGWNNPVITTTTYTYDASGTVTAMKVNEDQIKFKVYPERFGSEFLPAVEGLHSNGDVTAYFTDTTGRVSTIKSKEEELRFMYDTENRVVEKASHTKDGVLTLIINYDYSIGSDTVDMHTYKEHKYMRVWTYKYSSTVNTSPRPKFPFHYGNERVSYVVRSSVGCLLGCNNTMRDHFYVKDAAGNTTDEEVLHQRGVFASNTVFTYVPVRM